MGLPRRTARSAESAFGGIQLSLFDDTPDAPDDTAVPPIASAPTVKAPTTTTIAPEKLEWRDPVAERHEHDALEALLWIVGERRDAGRGPGLFCFYPELPRVALEGRVTNLRALVLELTRTTPARRDISLDSAERVLDDTLRRAEPFDCDAHRVAQRAEDLSSQALRQFYQKQANPQATKVLTRLRKRR